MSEFGGLWKHEETQHALKRGIIVSLLTVATLRKKKKRQTETDRQRPRKTQRERDREPETKTERGTLIIYGREMGTVMNGEHSNTLNRRCSEEEKKGNKHWPGSSLKLSSPASYPAIETGQTIVSLCSDHL